MIEKNSVTFNEKEKIWSGPQKESPNIGGESMGQLIVKTMMERPDQIGQICCDTNNVYTNRELVHLAWQIAHCFKDLNLEQTEVIGLCVRNSDFVAPVVFAALLCGLPVSSLDPSIDKDGIKHMFSITRPTVIFCDGSEYSTIKEAMDETQLNTKIYTLTQHVEGVPNITEFFTKYIAGSEFKPEPLKHGKDQLASIVCSSGTTGLPKAVTLSHSTWLNVNFCYLKQDDISLCWSNVYGISGMYNLFETSLRGAIRIVSEQTFSAERFFDIVQKYGVTTVGFVPCQLAEIVNSPLISENNLSTIRVYICGASAVPYNLVEKFQPFKGKATFLVNYATSEIGCVASVGVPTGDGSAGVICNNVQITIVGENGARLMPNKSGEIWIKPPIKWLGYYNNPEATQNIYDADGWIHSGDLGYVTETGCLFIVDRLTDILKYNNFHFYPSEIENVITELTGVADVIVCGIPDLSATFLPAAAVVRAPGSSITEADIYDHVTQRMAHFNHLHGGVYFVDKLPRTAFGKPLRNKVVELCESLRSGRNGEDIKA